MFTHMKLDDNVLGSTGRVESQHHCYVGSSVLPPCEAIPGYAEGHGVIKELQTACRSPPLEKINCAFLIFIFQIEKRFDHIIC